MSYHIRSCQAQAHATDPNSSSSRMLRTLPATRREWCFELCQLQEGNGVEAVSVYTSWAETRTQWSLSVMIQGLTSRGRSGTTAKCSMIMLFTKKKDCQDLSIPQQHPDQQFRFRAAAGHSAPIWIVTRAAWSFPSILRSKTTIIGIGKSRYQFLSIFIRNSLVLSGQYYLASWWSWLILYKVFLWRWGLLCLRYCECCVGWKVQTSPPRSVSTSTKEQNSKSSLKNLSTTPGEKVPGHI